MCALITNHLCWECFLVLSVYCETLHRDEEKEILSHGMWLLSNLEKKKSVFNTAKIALTDKNWSLLLSA